MRKSITYTVKSEGEDNRDNGKVFVITEMSCADAERWTLRLAFALGRSGAMLNLVEQIQNGGMASLVSVGIDALTHMPVEEAIPLLDELMTCVEFVPDPGSPNIKRSIIDSDIEEIATRMKLKMQVLDLHYGFFTNAAS